MSLIIQEPPAAGISDRSPLEFSIGGAAAGSPFVEVNSTDFTDVAIIRFAGTTKLGTPINIEIGAFNSNIAASIDLQILDLNNAPNIIAFLTTPITPGSVDPVLIDMGTLSNLPAAKAEWAIQARRVSAGKARVSTISVIF